MEEIEHIFASVERSKCLNHFLVSPNYSKASIDVIKDCITSFISPLFNWEYLQTPSVVTSENVKSLYFLTRIYEQYDLTIEVEPILNICVNYLNSPFAFRCEGFTIQILRFYLSNLKPFGKRRDNLSSNSFLLALLYLKNHLIQFEVERFVDSRIQYLINETFDQSNFELSLRFVQDYFEIIKYEKLYHNASTNFKNALSVLIDLSRYIFGAKQLNIERIKIVELLVCVINDVPSKIHTGLILENIAEFFSDFFTYILKESRCYEDENIIKIIGRVLNLFDKILDRYNEHNELLNPILISKLRKIIKVNLVRNLQNAKLLSTNCYCTVCYLFVKYIIKTKYVLNFESFKCLLNMFQTINSEIKNGTYLEFIERKKINGYFFTIIFQEGHKLERDLNKINSLVISEITLKFMTIRMYLISHQSCEEYLKLDIQELFKNFILFAQSFIEKSGACTKKQQLAIKQIYNKFRSELINNQISNSKVNFKWVIENLDAIKNIISRYSY
ncbi:hypothetical protein RF11_15235 [Thelohanellus kitauei]|uniref:Uncharacterized protein n=1 Tax=Thelohanellus kitauei TaxID=669202 RepID=A0A0C2IMX1_THEKT|nr:hypothetical protein RF11_15235 [Thelohanellus kitauei]